MLKLTGGNEHPSRGAWQEFDQDLLDLLTFLCTQALTIVGAIGRSFGMAAISRLARWNLEMWEMVTHHFNDEPHPVTAYNIRRRLTVEVLEEM